MDPSTKNVLANVTNVGVEQCPAFREGCPFSSFSRLEVAGCPAFSAGCPFKGARTASELVTVLKEVPESHGIQGSKAQVALAGLLKTTHSVQSGNCPVFAAECPFKEPLKHFVWQGWWMGEAEDDFVESTLSVALKEGTKEAHAEAERVQFVRALLDRRASLLSYVSLLAALRPVYKALEDASLRLGHADDKLQRVPSIDADLDFFETVDPVAVRKARRAADESPAVVAYVARLNSLDDSWLLVAHLYTRYLGDLSGGQILRRAVKRTFLGNDDSRGGVAFYDFPLIGGPTQLRRFKEQYRRDIDALHIPDLRPVVQEAVKAFRFNTALLAELDALLDPEPVLDLPAAPPSKKGAVCPFLAGKPPPKDATACPFSGAKPASAPASCPFATFGLRDFAIVGFLAVAFILAPNIILAAQRAYAS